MRLLAIDTSLAECAVAYGVGPEPLCARSETVERAHGERLMGMIGEVMAGAGADWDTLDRVATTVGPGSFTGVRIGIAAARGIALVRDVSAVGVSNLAVHAARAASMAGSGPVLAVTSAGRGQVYGQTFSAEGVASAPPKADHPENFAGLVGPDTRLAGSAAEIVAELAPDHGGIVHTDSAPDLATLFRLGVEAEDSDGEPLRPLYLRPPDAKPQTGSALPRRA